MVNLQTSQANEPIKLPPPQLDSGLPLMKALQLRQSTRNFDSKQLNLQDLSNLLWAAFGINRKESGKRTAPSAMNWQEIDIYVALKNGTFLYDAKSHILKPINDKDIRKLTGKQYFVEEAPVNLIYVADWNRMKYANEENKIIWSAVDAGSIMQNVYLYCASQALATVARGLFDKEALSKALHLNPEQKVILCQTVGYPKKI